MSRRYYQKRLNDDELLTELQNVMEGESDGGEIFSDNSEDDFVPPPIETSSDSTIESEIEDTADTPCKNTESGRLYLSLLLLFL